MLSDRCPVCLSVTLVGCGQTAGWIWMSLGMEIRLDQPRRHCVGWGPSCWVLTQLLGFDPAPLPRKGAQAGSSPHVRFDPLCSLTLSSISATVELGAWDRQSDGRIAALLNMLLLLWRAYANITLRWQSRLTPVGYIRPKLECGPMPNVMAALPNIGGALCSTPQFG